MNKLNTSKTRTQQTMHTGILPVTAVLHSKIDQHLYKAFCLYSLMGGCFLCPLHISRSNTPIGPDVVGGKSGRNHPTSRRDPIHIGRMARNAYICVDWYMVPGSSTILYDSLVGTVKESYLLQISVALYTFGSRSADDLPMVSR